MSVQRWEPLDLGNKFRLQFAQFAWVRRLTTPGPICVADRAAPIKWHQLCKRGIRGEFFS